MMEVASIAIYGFLTKPSIWTEIIIAHQRKGKAMDELISRQAVRNEIESFARKHNAYPIAVYDAIKKGDINIFAQNNSVSVLTMHSAKGLEWEYVYIPFITNNVFPKCPYWELDKNTDNIKSERNLFYVALTRAKERLFITYSTESANPKYHAGPSLFIKELDKKLYKAPKISKR